MRRGWLFVGATASAVLGVLGGSARGSAPRRPQTAPIAPEPEQTVYIADWASQTSAVGVVAWTAVSPFEPLPIDAGSGVAGGGLALDPEAGRLYGSTCCSASSHVLAYDAVSLTRLPSADIALATSGAMTAAVDVPARVLYALDTVSLQLTALSLGTANYGASVAQVALTGVTADTTPVSSGNTMAFDWSAHRLFVTGGDGGPIVTVDTSAISSSGGAFGAIAVVPSQTARSTGHSGGALAIDVVGRHVFTLGAAGVHSFGADAPYTTSNDTVLTTAVGSAGMFFDPRTRQLWVGGGPGLLSIIDVDHDAGIQSAADTSALPGRAITGNPLACPSTAEDGGILPCFPDRGDDDGGAEDAGAADAAAPSEGGSVFPSDGASPADSAPSEGTDGSASGDDDASPSNDGGSPGGGTSGGGGCSCRMTGGAGVDSERGAAGLLLFSFTAVAVRVRSRRRRRGAGAATDRS